MSSVVKMIVSIDVEEDNWQPVRDGLVFENIRELPQLHKFLRGLGVRPTYFPTYQVGSVPWTAAILRDLDEAGECEVAAHLHPWNTPPYDEPLEARNSMAKNLPVELQAEKIRRTTDRLHEVIGHAPTTFRTGRFGFGASTARALLKCGYRIDSSVTPFVSWRDTDGGPSFRGAPLEIYRLDGSGDVRIPCKTGGLVEVPISSGFNRLTPSRWYSMQRLVESAPLRSVRMSGMLSRLGIFRPIILTPETHPLADLIALSRRLVDGGSSFLHMFWHSVSLLPGLGPFAGTRSEVESLHSTIGRFIETLSRDVRLEFATVGEAGSAFEKTSSCAAPGADQEVLR